MNGRLLIVDDTPANLEVLVGELERRGYDVAVAQDGEEALQRAAYVQPDLVLLDVMMPGIDGFETCRRLKAGTSTSDIPVIFMTALGDANSKLIGFGCGGVDYITKPFQLDEVVARVQTQLALRASQRELAEKHRALEEAHERLRESESRYRQQVQELQHRATHDALTGLPNRTLLSDRLEQAIAFARRRSTRLRVCFVDLDGFKQINDRLGHEAGDTVLCMVAQRITACLRKSDTVARLGGDEFVVLLQDCDGDDGAAVLSRVEAAVSQPIDLGTQRVTVACSMGRSSFPEDGASPEALLRAADMAMYRAKAAAQTPR